MEEEDIDMSQLFYLVEESISALISLQTKRMGDRSLGFNETDIRNFTDKDHGNLTSMMRKVINQQFLFCCSACLHYVTIS